MFTAGLVCLLIAFLITPFVKMFALWIGATDTPDDRKVHLTVMPRLGGLAIILSFITGLLIFNPTSNYFWPILTGALLIALTGMLDDLFDLPANAKFFFPIDCGWNCCVKRSRSYFH